MASISKCPRCGQSVTIPDGVAAEARVRCPLCSAEYPLGEALAGVPPTLIVVEAPAVVAPPPLPEPVAPPAVVEAPPLPPLPAPPVAVHDHDWMSAEAAATEEGEEAVAESEHEPFDAAAFSGISKEPAAGDDKKPPPGVPRWRARSKRKARNPVKDLIGALVGGFVGLTIGYYLLNWFGGPRFNFLDFDLPFLPSKQSGKPESENNAGTWIPDQRSPFDRFAV